MSETNPLVVTADGDADTHGAGVRSVAHDHPARSVVGGFYLFTGGVHLGIVGAGTGFYRHFADQSPVSFVHDRWADVFMPNATFWGLCLVLGETVLGILLFQGGRWAKVGWVGVIAFNALLVLFGWGFLLWSVPAVGVLTFLAVKDWPRLSGRGVS